MFDQSKMSSASSWLFAGAAPRLSRRTPACPCDADIQKMWVISGPAGMSLEVAKQALGVRPSPRDLVIYSQHKGSGGLAQVPRLISCQPYRH